MDIALIKGGKVENIISGSMDFAGQLQGYDYVIEVTGQGVGIGWNHDGEKFIAPQSQGEVTPAQETRLSYLEFFLGRFTETELWAIEMATEIIGEENRRLRLAMGLMKKAEYISLQDPRTEQFLNELTSAGVLAPGRVAEILTA